MPNSLPFSLFLYTIAFDDIWVSFFPNLQLFSVSLPPPHFHPKKQVKTATFVLQELLFTQLDVSASCFEFDCCCLRSVIYILHATGLKGTCVLVCLIRAWGRVVVAIIRLRDKIANNNVRLFSYNSLRSATSDFHPSNRIGGGGFGVVYRGVLRDGTRVAIKALSAESKQGSQEFLTEINMISNIRHPNLVELIGCCVEGNHRLLVYEYMENNSLASVLLGSKARYVSLDWPKRAAICLGVASGLAFLHNEAEPNIVHRDIKASNILLDGNFCPKIGDFGLAKLFPDNVTHVSTRVAGTLGYLAPEYALLRQLTKKVDVYSFGVLVLEIISGRSSSKSAFGMDMLLLVEWTWKLKEEERLLDIVDPNIRNYPEDEVTRFIKVALFCTQASAHQRPTMKQVVEMLSKNVHLNEKILSEPGVYKGRARDTQHLGGSSTEETSSSLRNKGKRSIDLPVTSSHVISDGSSSQILPR